VTVTCTGRLLPRTGDFNEPKARFVGKALVNCYYSAPVVLGAVKDSEYHLKA
jgi:hypothetical protein